MRNLLPGLGLALAALCAGCYFDLSGIAVFDLGAPDTLLPEDGSIPDGVAPDVGLPEDGAVERAEIDQGLPADQGLPVDQAAVIDQELFLDQSPQLDLGDTPDGQPTPCAGLTCPLGCNVAQDRCYRVKPTGFSVTDSEFALSLGALAPGSSTVELVIDTTDGSITQDGTVIRPSNQPKMTVGGIYWKQIDQGVSLPKLSVFIVDSLTIGPATKVRLVGEHVFVLYAKGDILIEGDIDANAEGKVSGPGGYDGGLSNGADGQFCFGGEGNGGLQGCGDRGCTWTYDAGGGGGGHAAKGGDGGDIPGYIIGSPGGATTLSVAVPQPKGGCGGGAGGGPNGGYSSWPGGFGGGGGGAVQIVANGTLELHGSIAVQGAGGGGGISGAGGGGGGAGGLVLLEAVEVQSLSTSFIAANGGGGGSGGSDDLDGEQGQTGQLSTARAAGGAFTGLYGGEGGEGGSGAGGQGLKGGSADANGGGGGGAVGRILVNGKSTTLSPNRTSPDPALGNVVIW